MNRPCPDSPARPFPGVSFQGRNSGLCGPTTRLLRHEPSFPEHPELPWEVELAWGSAGQAHSWLGGALSPAEVEVATGVAAEAVVVVGALPATTGGRFRPCRRRPLAFPSPGRPSFRMASCPPVCSPRRTAALGT